MKLPALRRGPREHMVTLDGRALESRIMLPTSLKLDVAHTITRNPPPKPHSLSLVLNAPNGNRWIGNPTFIHGTESRLYLPVPGTLLYLRDWERDTYTPVGQLECEVWWNH